MREPAALKSEQTRGQYSIAGVLVHSKVERAASVEHDLLKLPGVEVHGAEGGKLIVTIEEFPGDKILLTRISEINAIPGVLNASLIYTESEPNCELADSGCNSEDKK